MDKDIKTPGYKFSGVNFQIFPTDYHTWVFPVFVQEAPMKGGPKGIPKWVLRTRTREYLGRPPSHLGLVPLLLNTITGNVPPQYHMIFDDILFTVENIRKGTVPVNWENFVDEHSDLSTQGKTTL